jgi:hypothetical protein
MRSSLSLLIFIAVMLAAATSLLPASKSKLTPTNDVCVRTDYPNTAGAAAGTLLCVGGPIGSTGDYWVTFIKFNLTNFATDQIDSARLYLTAQAYSGSGRWVSAYEVTSDTYNWNENYMSWATACTTLTVSGTVADKEFVDTTDTPGRLVWDVTSEAQSHKGGNFSLCLKETYQPTNGSWAKLYSKDQTITGYVPYLWVSYSTPGGSHRLFGWEGSGTILGASAGYTLNFDVGVACVSPPAYEGNCCLASNFILPTDDPPVLDLAWVQSASPGDTVTAGFWRYDVAIGTPSCVIWGRWNDSPICTGDAGDAGGNPDIGPGTGWTHTSQTWVVPQGHSGLVIQCRLYGNPGDHIWIDALEVSTNNPGAIIHLPDEGPSSVESATWGTIKALFK